MSTGPSPQQVIDSLAEENRRLKLSLASLVEGIDRWNEAVAEVIDRTVNHVWPELESARKLLKELE